MGGALPSHLVCVPSEGVTEMSGHKSKKLSAKAT